MNLMVVGYIHKDSNSVVVDKSIIKNAKDNEFEEIVIVLDEDFIKEKYEELEFLTDEDDEEDF